MALPSFPIDGSLFDVPGLVVGGELSQVAVEESTVVFTPNFKYATEPVVWEGTVDWVRQVWASVAPDGTLLPIAPDGTVGSPPVLLLANDPGLNITGLQWNCKVSLRSGDGGMSFWFDAPTNGSAVDLSALAPSPGSAAQGVVVTMAMVDQAIADALLGGGGGDGTGLVYNPATGFWMVSESGSVLTLNGTTNFWEVTA